MIIFHIEAVPEPRPLLQRIRAAGCQASLALNPPTPFSAIEPYLDEMDALLVMSVMPGFGGQAFEAAVLDKVRAARAARPDLRISIDGGIKPNTAEEAAAAGVSQLVAGSAVFRNPGKYATALAELRALLGRSEATLDVVAAERADALVTTICTWPARCKAVKSLYGRST